MSLVIDTSQGLSVWAGSLPPEALAIAEQKRSHAMWPYIPMTALAVAASLGRVLMIIVGAALAGGEFAWETGRHLIGRTRDRSAFVISKAVVIAALALVLLTGALIVGTFSGGGLTPIAHEGTMRAFPLAAIWFLPLALLAATLTLLPYAFLAFTITFITRSTVAGVAVGLLTLLVGEPLLAQILIGFGEPWRELVNYTPIVAAHSVRDWIGAVIDGEAPQQPGRSVIVLLGYTLVLAGLAVASFRRRELP